MQHREKSRRNRHDTRNSVSVSVCDVSARASRRALRSRRSSCGAWLALWTLGSCGTGRSSISLGALRTSRSSQSTGPDWTGCAGVTLGTHRPRRPGWSCGPYWTICPGRARLTLVSFGSRHADWTHRSEGSDGSDGSQQDRQVRDRPCLLWVPPPRLDPRVRWPRPLRQGQGRLCLPWDPTARRAPVVLWPLLAPSSPVGPAGPGSPVSPLSPFDPAAPTGPTGPTGPMGPMGPIAPSAPAGLQNRQDLSRRCRPLARPALARRLRLGMSTSRGRQRSGAVARFG